MENQETNKTIDQKALESSYDYFMKTLQNPNQNETDTGQTDQIKPIVIYNITNQESWAAATRTFFVQFFTFATIFAILAFLTDATGCVDMAEVIHGR